MADMDGPACHVHARHLKQQGCEAYDMLNKEVESNASALLGACTPFSRLTKVFWFAETGVNPSIMTVADMTEGVWG
jgi:hypothetical protein